MLNPVTNLRKKKLLAVSVIALASLLGLIAITSSKVGAEGTYIQVGTTNGSDAGFDAVSWSQGYPIMIDSFGKFIVLTQQDGTGILDFTYSNDGGSNWGEIPSTSTNRTSAVYDPINDKIHAISTNSSTGQVVYIRYVIRRDVDYNIETIEVDPGTTFVILDSGSGCDSADARNPIALWKNSGTNGTLAVFWSTQKTCSGTTTTETRASMRILSNTAADFSVGNWAALNGVSDETGANGPAAVDYNELYVFNGTHYVFQHSAMISTGGTNNNDIYYFNIDENDTHGFRRLNWNATDWSGSWTARTTFGGDVGDGNGYNLKKELLTKPVLATTQDRVYVGIARWLGGGLGDTQSLYQVAANDTVTLVQDLYSAGGTHCLYPTLDIAYDQTQNQVYSFYLTTGAGNDCGDTYFKTYDGTSISSGSGWWTTPNQSIDIPIVYQNRYNDRLHLFFRVNNLVTPSTPPHDIYYGYQQLSTTPVTPQTVSASAGSYTATTQADFDQTCAVINGASVRNINGGEIATRSAFQDDFNTPTAPYQLLFRDLWTSGVYSAGVFDPKPTGQLITRNPSNGAFTQSVNTFSINRTLEFRATFTAHNFEHIGFTDDTSIFSDYVMFSTGGDATLRARVSNGSETAVVIGAGNLGSMHTYRIEWTTGDVNFYIDGVQVADITTNVPNNPLRVITSNNTSTAGADLAIDWILLRSYTAGSTTYQSCAIDSGVAGTLWQQVSYANTLPAGTSLTVETRTSSDGATWGSWSGGITSGNATTSPAGRYIQYRVTLNSTTTNAPELNSITLNYDLAPNVPTNLGGTDVTTGGSIVSQTPSFTFDITDPDVADTVGYQIIIDDNSDFASPLIDYSSALAAQGNQSFTVGQAEGGGTYSIGSAATNLTQGTSYYWRVRSFDDSTVYSAYVAANGGAVAFSVATPSSSTTTTTSSSTTTSSTTTSSSASSSVSSTTSSAVGNVGSSTTTSSGTTCAVTKPTTPEIISAQAVNDNQISITIDSDGATFEKYVVEYGMVSGNYIFNPKEQDGTLGNAVIIKSLSPNTKYYFRVKTVNGCASSDYSTEKSATTFPLDVSVSGEGSQSSTSAPAGSGQVAGIDWQQVGLFCILPLAILLLIIFFLSRKKEREDEN